MADTFKTEPIAIVGSSCRFPGGASSPSKLWDLLKQPRNLLQEIPSSRFNPQGFYHEDGDHHGSTNVKHAYLLEEDHRLFDNMFFGIHPKEAESMDPQQRILLETVYEGIERAGYSLQQLRGSPTAVFVGLMNSDYLHLLFRDLDSVPQYLATGAGMSIVANRVSYFFDWKGPSVAIDTACSSSMVALHQAVQVLRSGEASLAVAAGTNLILGPEAFIFESKLHMLSPNGRSRMWDASVDGYTRGEGFAAVVLKPLSRAMADGDHIECIIRETGVNQDGRTPGITMPSAEAQAALIRSTYARCGLDLNQAQDRPQYFEAHGTGTPAGDPIEAEAIQRVFFPAADRAAQHDELLVGSIKTIIGHLEGSAGLAGVVKASLAIQKGVVPPNLHFNELNPAIRPFYDHLRVPTAATRWPALPPGVPRRASVNSFGFGGTNAHAILEGWNQEDDAGSRQQDTDTMDQVRDAHDCYAGGPFVLSANSGQALTAAAAALSSHLKAQPDTSLADVAYTLTHRSEFPFRAAFSATTTARLVEKLDSFASSKPTPSPAIPETLPPRILGVFTGQGAQWPGMGKQLYRASALFRASMNQMQRSLEVLPDGPEWSLIDQLLAPAETSRVHQAAVSQPLCTAMQVALVDLLRAAGITFSAVVGHSSGEIAAAYAAGYLSATDAIRVAYYRGVYAKLARGQQGQTGKMMAVGLSLEQATSFCSEFDAGTIAVAASNSRTSCTLAGDANVIQAAKERLDERDVFARLLQVDTAYHSHHMQPCAEPYLEALRGCGVTTQDEPRHCNWYSSVYGPNGRSRSFDDGKNVLAGPYWVANMTQPVLFSQAVQRAVAEEHCYDLVLEVGPHPALKGPSSETIKALTGRELPYAGVLKRAADSVESFGDALGSIWVKFLSPRPVLDFGGIRRAFSGQDDDTDTGSASAVPRLLKNLPGYCWDHNKPLWKESRKSKAFRTRREPIHELLGHAVVHGEPEASRREMRWRQVLKLGELPWARGHVFQGQVLFPAAGYVSMAYEAAVHLVDGDRQPVRLVELYDLDIVRAITLDENSAGTDVAFTIRVTSQTADCITAEYACYSGAVDAIADGQDGGDKVNFTGRVDLHLGAPAPDSLPARVGPQLPMEPLDVDRLYSYVSEIGLDYSGDFRAESVCRRLNQATVTVRRPADAAAGLRIHPATLDAAFHGIFAGFSFPNDGRLWTTYLPTRIDRVRVNPMIPMAGAAAPLLTADCTVTAGDARAITGDVDLYSAEDGHAEVQVRGLTCTCFTKADAHSDRRLYARHEWVRDAGCGIEPSKRVQPSADSRELGEICERSAYYYCRKLRDEIDVSELPGMAWNHRHLMDWLLKHLLPRIEAGQHPWVRSEWAHDTAEMVEAWRAAYPGQIDLQLIHAVGENMPAIVRGTMPPLQVLTQDGMLDRLYTDGLGFREANEDLAVLAGQLAHRHPQMKVLEIGAGTGGATRGILGAIRGRFASYTYTDISAGFFENARTIFREHADRMVFKTLNIESDPVEQGYEPGGYDCIVASNVLHATSDLQNTLRQCRKLLRPGGYLMLLEITREYLRPQFIVGSLPGWFLGIDDGRVWAPTVSEATWDDVLKKTGFSGVDSSATSYFAVMTSQAVEDGPASPAMVLRAPLSAPIEALPPISNLLIIGGGGGGDGTTTTSIMLVQETCDLLRPRISGTVTVLPTLEYIKAKEISIPYGTAVLCLSDLDSPVFRDMHKRRFEALQDVVRNAGMLLWVTQGALSGRDPVANMVIGWGRSLLLESPTTKLQFVDLDRPESASAAVFAEMLLRLACAGRPEFEGVLWTHEHELALVDGAVYIPRIRQNEPLNHRLNSAKRTITQPVSLRDAKRPVQVVHQSNGGGPELQVASPYRSRLDNDSVKANVVQVQVAVSSAYALSTSGGHATDDYYLCVGSVTGTGEKVLALSPANASVVNVPEADVLAWPGTSAEDDGTRLHRLITALLVESHLAEVEGPVVWVHGADSSLAQAIEEALRARGLDVFFSTSDTTNWDPRMHFIHPYISERDLLLLRPPEAKTFVNMQQQQQPALDQLIRSLMAASGGSVRQPYYSSVVRENNSLSLLYGRPVLRSLIKQHLDAAADTPPGTPPTGEAKSQKAHMVVAIDRLSSSLDGSALQPAATTPAVVIDWRTVDTVSAHVRPLRYNGMFSPHKTYLLAGLTGDVGLSLCEWMADHGARHIVISSRNPKVPQSVVDHLARKGLTLRIEALDVSDREALHALYADIKATMPPVGGVMNAAMVLRDRSFVNTSWADFAAVLAPKVRGSENLDELFHDDNDGSLDFFVLFSSLACIVGNAGQAAYGAANLFMTSLAEQRRARGLPASVVHIAMLLGLGYVHRAESGAQYEARLGRNSFMALAETDLHNMIAEAIVCGRPDSGQPVELITGLGRAGAAEWRDNPRFSHYLVDEEGAQGPDGADTRGAGAAQAKQGAKSVEAQLADAADEEAAVAVLEDAFTEALGNILQVDADRLDKNVPLTGLGIDSLVAVQIRAWFLKEVGVDIPVLKVLGDHSLTELCKDALAGRRRRQQGQEQGQGQGQGQAAAAMDWDKELESLLGDVAKLIPAGIEADVAPTTTTGSSGRGLRIVLTGATGFLGTGILRELVSNARVSEVHCIAIRPDAGGRPRHVKVRHDKISEYAGDLKAPLLGLSASDFAQLARRADVILHNGAEVSFLKSYGALRAANVGSTQALLAMAAPRRVPVHFVSTAAVALLQDDGATELPEVPVSHVRHLRPPHDIEGSERTQLGYATSKWVSEALLEQASRELGVPAVVHRSVMVLGDGAPATDLMTVLDRYSAQLSAVPALDSRHVRGVLDIVDVADVVAGVVKAAIDDGGDGAALAPGALVVRNYCNEHKFRAEELQAHYRDKTRQDIALWPMEKWLDGAATLGLDKMVEFFFRSAYQSGMPLPVPSLRKGEV